MTDPLAEQLAELAPTVDSDAAFNAFVARRAHQRRRRRFITGGVAALVLVAGGVGVALLQLADDPGTVASPTSRPTVTPPPAASSATTASPTLATPPTTTAAALLTVDGCPDIVSTDLRSIDGPNLFGRAMPDDLSIQAVATTAGVQGPYAAVVRYRSATRPPTFGDVVDIDGHQARVFTGPEGQGQISWILDDGSEADIRSRYLSADELVAIARALVPRPLDAPIVGFDLSADTPDGFTLVAEATASSEAQVASMICHFDNGHDLRVGVIDAPLAIQYALGNDNLPLPLLQQRGPLTVFAVSNDPTTAATALGVAPPPTTPDAHPPGGTVPVTVDFTIERSAVGQPGCSAPACRFVDVTVHGFAPGTTVTITCQSDTTGPFSSTDITIGDDATASYEACYFGYPDARFWVVANGFTSPTITWPTQ